MITSTANKKVKELAELSVKAKARAETGLFLAEGRKLFMEAPPEQIESVYVEENAYRGADTAMREKLDRVSFELVSGEVFRKISDTMTPQGIMTVVRQKKYETHALLNKTDGRAAMLLILENIQDPGNLGTIFRTAEAVGASGIIMTRHSVDVYNPKTIRSTMGSVYRMPFCYVRDLAEGVRGLKECGIQTYAAHLEGRCDYDKEDYCRPCAFLIGNEGNGLTEEIARLADTYIKIPMQGQVESLNAAVAASILMFEAARQRRQTIPANGDAHLAESSFRTVCRKEG